jgi:hypothetical protein
MVLINAGNIINSSSLDKYFRDGDLLCNKIMFEMKAKGTFQSRLMSFEEIPVDVSCHDKNEHVSSKVRSSCWCRC